MKINENRRALEDAEKCIAIDSKNWKGYCLKAHAIAKMVKHKDLPTFFEKAGLA